MSDQTDREAKLREIAKKQVRFRLPGMDTVFMRSGTYGNLPMDVYYPSQPQAADRLPVVVVAFGYPDPEGQIRQYGPMTSWARLMAASGLAVVVYGSRQPAEDIHVLLRHLRTNAATLHIDERRIGLWSTSGSVPVALSALMRDPELSCAALLYGYTMDLNGSTSVADTAAQYGFVNACAGKSVDDLPASVPIFIVRAGREQFSDLNEALDVLVCGMLARNLPLTFVNHADGVHGFELEEDTSASRAVVTGVLDFLRRALVAPRPE